MSEQRANEMNEFKPLLTEPQLRALKLLKDCEGYDDGWGVVTSGVSMSFDGQASINLHTALALQRRGLVEGPFDPEDEGELRLSGRGRKVLADA